MNEFELRDIIEKLEKRIENLEKEVESLKTNHVEEPIEDDKSLGDYYIDLYKNEALAIKNKRLDAIRNEIQELNTNYQKVVNEYQVLQDRLFNYSENVTRSEQIKEVLEKLYLEQENSNFNFDRKCNNLYKDVEYLDDIYNEKVNRYVNAVGAFTDGDLTVDELRVKIEQLILYFTEEGYKKATVLVDLVNNIDNLTLSHNNELNIINTKIQDLSDELDSLDLEDPTEVVAVSQNKIDELEDERIRKSTVLESMEELLDSLMENHLETLYNSINYLYLLDLSKQELSNKLDNLTKELLNKLETSDTEENRRNNLLLRLDEIDKRINELSDSVAKRSTLEQEFEDRKDILEMATVNEQELTNYVEKIYTVIRSNQVYRNYFDSYVSANTKIKELTNLISNTKSLNESYREQRKLLVLDPYAKEKLIDLDEIIATNDHKISQALQEISFIKDELKNSSAMNERLYKFISEKETAEDALPKIREQKEKLSIELTRRYEELHSYDDLVEEYNELVKEAEDLNEHLQNRDY